MNYGDPPPPPWESQQGRSSTSSQRSSDSLNLLFQGGPEQLEQQVLLALVGAVVEEGEDDGLHELGGFALRHLEDELGQVGGVGLQQVEEVLVGFHPLMALPAQCPQAPHRACLIRALGQLAVVGHHVLRTVTEITIGNVRCMCSPPPHTSTAAPPVHCFHASQVQLHMFTASTHP